METDNQYNLPPQKANVLAQILVYVVFICIAFHFSHLLAAFIIILAIGGNGKKWFNHNAYLYSTTSATINGVLWGLLMGILAAISLIWTHPTKPVAIGFLVWSLISTAYSGYGKGPAPALLRDGSHTNLATIQISAILSYLLSVSIILFLWR